MYKIFLLLGSINAFLSVALGAFGAHILKSRIPANMLANYETGVQYHMAHALGLILVAILADKLGQGGLITWAGWALFIGIIFFSGSLYVMALTGVRTLGAITPIGGMAFLTGWILLAVSSFRS
ncbi:DUF423 domain-containing protein [Paenibacillus larvae]|uniref:DUF423 domain-containing protein n=1 Tax=Paenibacillus larvae subsp. larvae DSM 25430 TaxID=697284 RepID=V9W3H4_9BACL|nr:DUF423 domain-containing protein [Paenibacillus larvae]AHD04494.1 hypothetical protein ERIC2_c06520 [Paenibacillus larvae subsp. larvae DSM 25430]AVG11097.1 hypothetical protein ERICII_00660 [Paenibacillus larvae subsp. larvae DSM 25430]MDR5567139.1 DUF423 domain-containing protein [Paenibacillus larvae]MDR5594858.1 DUF423 domain-containing protein [Paenibacillus larvae]